MSVKRERETVELIRACRRMIKAVVVRAADDDPDTISQMIVLKDYLDVQIMLAVQAQRAAGMTWQALADQLGVTRQACIMRWAPR